MGFSLRTIHFGGPFMKTTHDCFFFRFPGDFSSAPPRPNARSKAPFSSAVQKRTLELAQVFSSQARRSGSNLEISGHPGGFPARHGGTPIARWMVFVRENHGKSHRSKWMMSRDSPIIQETSEDFRKGKFLEVNSMNAPRGGSCGLTRNMGFFRISEGSTMGWVGG